MKSLAPAMVAVALIITSSAIAQTAQPEAVQQSNVDGSTVTKQQADQAGSATQAGTPTMPATEQASAAVPADDKASKAGNFIVGTVQSPLKDLNLVKDDIPPLLSAAKKDVYGIPAQANCAGLHAEILQLDALLGADLDAANTAEKLSLAERGAALVGKETARAVSGAVNGLVPYRGWVRKLTGAEKHSKEVTSAIAAGSARRSFLKGLSAGMGCKAIVEAKS